jgi:hypothetical protein
MSNEPLTTFQMRRLGRRTVLLGAVSLAAGLTGATRWPAHAARGWCRSDPLVSIDGILAYVVCSAPPAIRQNVTGPTEIIISVPLGIDASLVSHGSGFGKGDTVRFKQSSSLARTDAELDVEINVRVPASEKLPVGVEFAPLTNAGQKDAVFIEGHTNSWITLTTQLDRTSTFSKRSTKRRRR